MSIIHRYLMMIVMAIPFTINAQSTSNPSIEWGMDVPTIEAYIADHRHQRALLQTRSLLEIANATLHDATSQTVVSYESINTQLDKYTRAFDVIDFLYQSTRTVLNVRDTYNSVSGNIRQYGTMLSDFNEKCLKRGNIESADTLLISVSLKCIQKVGGEVDEIVNSLNDLVLYATGTAACSSSDLMAVVESINTSLDNIRCLVNSAYMQTWRYIQVRTGYWKSSVYRSIPIGDIVNNAIERWKEVSRPQRRPHRPMHNMKTRPSQ